MTLSKLLVRLGWASFTARQLIGLCSIAQGAKASIAALALWAMQQHVGTSVFAATMSN